MFARTSTWTGTPEAIDKWVAGAETVRTFVEALDGNAGVYFFVDRSAHTALTLTLWKTNEAARVSDASADASRARTVAATGVALLERGAFEVVERPGER